MTVVVVGRTVVVVGATVVVVVGAVVTVVVGAVVTVVVGAVVTVVVGAVVVGPVVVGPVVVGASAEAWFPSMATAIRIAATMTTRATMIVVVFFTYSPPSPMDRTFPDTNNPCGLIPAQEGTL